MAQAQRAVTAKQSAASMRFCLQILRIGRCMICAAQLQAAWRESVSGSQSSRRYSAIQEEHFAALLEFTNDLILQTRNAQRSKRGATLWLLLLRASLQTRLSVCVGIGREGAA